MTKAEKIAVLQEKASNLLKWFEGKEWPPGPIFLYKWMIVTDSKQFFESQAEIMKAHKSNPYCIVFVTAYGRLNLLKLYMDGIQKLNDNS